MRIIFLLIFIGNVLEINAENLEGVDKNRSYHFLNSIKNDMNIYCLKCKLKSSDKLEKLSIKIQKFLMNNQKDKYWYEIKEILISVYSQLAYGFHGGDYGRSKFEINYKNTIRELVQEERFPNPEIIFLAIGIEKNENNRNKLLNRILINRGYLFQAENMEGLYLISKGDIERGLESLTIAVYLANHADAHRYGEYLALILKKYNKKYLSKYILKKVFPEIKDNKKIDEKYKNLR